MADKFAFRPARFNRDDEKNELIGHNLFQLGRSQTEVAKFAALNHPTNRYKILEGYAKAEAVRKEGNATRRKAD